MDSNKIDLVVSSTSGIDFTPTNQAPVAPGKINGQTETDTTGANKEGAHTLNIFEILSQLSEILYRLYSANSNRAVTQSQIEIAKLNNQYASLSKKEDSIECSRRAGMINAIVGTVAGSVSAAVGLGSCRGSGMIWMEIANTASKGVESGFNVWSTTLALKGSLLVKRRMPMKWLPKTRPVQRKIKKMTPLVVAQGLKRGSNKPAKWPANCCVLWDGRRNYLHTEDHCT